jgi:hypothetical protein
MKIPGRNCRRPRPMPLGERAARVQACRSPKGMHACGTRYGPKEHPTDDETHLWPPGEIGNGPVTGATTRRRSNRSTSKTATAS